MFVLLYVCYICIAQRHICEITLLLYDVNLLFIFILCCTFVFITITVTSLMSRNMVILTLSDSGHFKTYQLLSRPSRRSSHLASRLKRCHIPPARARARPGSRDVPPSSGHRHGPRLIPAHLRQPLQQITIACRYHSTAAVVGFSSNPPPQHGSSLKTPLPLPADHGATYIYGCAVPDAAPHTG